MHLGAQQADRCHALAAAASPAQPGWPSTSGSRSRRRSRSGQAALQQQHDQLLVLEAWSHLLFGRSSRWSAQGGGLDWGAQQLPGLCALGAVMRPLGPPGRAFRFWIDYQAFSSPESAALPEAALTALGGVKTGGPPKLDPVTAVKQKIRDYGYMHLSQWELLLSITAKAMLAAEVLRPYQMVSIVPGCLCISRKTSLVRTLLNAYGPGAAFSIVPRTFKLPEELDAWADWVRAHPKQDTGLWMLKNNKQRGTGLRLVPTGDAFKAAFETTTRPGLEGISLYRWYLAQQYITAPLLINARKFGLRLWVAVPGVSPLRVYLHRAGLALFSSAPYTPADASRHAWGSGHITNFAQNENGDVWGLQQLAEHIGHDTWQGVWAQLARVTALVFAAALRRIQEVQAQMDLAPRQTFQYFGLDFLLDAQLHPWLMEVNATPSMKVAHEQPATAALIQQQKAAFIGDMFRLLRISEHGFQEATMRRPVDTADVAAELQLRGGLLPLMHLFPDEDSHPGLSIPWTVRDAELQAWLANSSAYQQAVKELQAAHCVPASAGL